MIGSKLYTTYQFVEGKIDIYVKSDRRKGIVEGKVYETCKGTI